MRPFGGLSPCPGVVEVGGAVARAVMREVLPGYSGAVHVENRVEYIAEFDFRRPAGGSAVEPACHEQAGGYRSAGCQAVLRVFTSDGLPVPEASETGGRSRATVGHAVRTVRDVENRGGNKSRLPEHACVNAFSCLLTTPV